MPTQNGAGEWEPEWRVHIGPVVEIGRGLLTPRIWKQRHLIDRFLVFLQPHNLVIGVDLHTGAISFDQTIVEHVRLPVGARARLIWYRRMQKEMGEYDANSAPFTCAHYGIGWQATVAGRNIKVGYMIDAGGRVKEGLPDSAPT